MEIKTGKIISCKLNGNPYPGKKGLIYYHIVVMDNGDKGSCGSVEPNPPHLAVGEMLDYEYTQISETEWKIKRNTKFVPQSTTGKQDEVSTAGTQQKKSQAKSQTKAPGYKKQDPDLPDGRKFSYAKHREDFLGYSVILAKDLLIAGKTSPEDIATLKRMSAEIYDQFIALLENGRDNKEEEKQEQTPDTIPTTLF